MQGDGPSAACRGIVFKGNLGIVADVKLEVFTIIMSLDGAAVSIFRLPKLSSCVVVVELNFLLCVGNA